MAKALLILTGGRGIPDMLVIKYLRPDIIFNLTTKQGLETAQHLAKFVHTEFGCQMKILPTINLNKEKEVKDACTNALKSYNDAEWVISITSAPKTMGIFAVDVARENNIPCWHLNTDDKEVISFSKNIPIDIDRLFEANVEQYMKLYERNYEMAGGSRYRMLAESWSWYEVAKTLAHMPEATHKLLKALRQEVKKKHKGEATSLAAEPQAKALVHELQKYDFLTITHETADTLRQELKKKYTDETVVSDEAVTLTVEPQAKALVHELQKHDFLTITHETADILQCTIADNAKQKFLEGGWLETYVWREVKNADFAHDCQWGYKILIGQAKNELDVAFTYRGILLIVECKTGNDPFTGNSRSLDTLDSVANSLGRTYTSKFFVTNHPTPEDVQSYESFCAQAKQRKILVITGQDLRNIGAILKQEAETPSIERT